MIFIRSHVQTACASFLRYGLTGQVGVLTPKESHEAAKCEPMYDQIPDFLIGGSGAEVDDGSAYDKHTT